MEKLISGASTGSRRKRAGLGPTESASRPRRGERSSGGDGPQSAKAARRARDAGDSRGLARSLAGTAAEKPQGETLRPAARSDRPPRAPGTHCRRHPLAPHPLARHHVRRRSRRRRRRQRLPGASGPKASANERRAQPYCARGPAPLATPPSGPAPPPPFSRTRLGSVLRGSTRSAQGDPWKGGAPSAPLVAFSLLPSPRTPALPFRTV